MNYHTEQNEQVRRMLRDLTTALQRGNQYVAKTINEYNVMKGDLDNKQTVLNEMLDATELIAKKYDRHYLEIKTQVLKDLEQQGIKALDLKTMFAKQEHELYNRQKELDYQFKKLAAAEAAIAARTEDLEKRENAVLDQIVTCNSLLSDLNKKIADITAIHADIKQAQQVAPHTNIIVQAEIDGNIDDTNAVANKLPAIYEMLRNIRNTAQSKQS